MYNDAFNEVKHSVITCVLKVKHVYVCRIRAKQKSALLHTVISKNINLQLELQSLLSGSYPNWKLKKTKITSISEAKEILDTVFKRNTINLLYFRIFRCAFDPVN